MTPAPDGREQDCPEAGACDGRCDLHEVGASWVDRFGDVWTSRADGLMYEQPETRPFPREHVEKKWGPLRKVTPP
ncbi:hypothetical protein [Nocardioides sp. ChNu-99]|uniref:hypothetical protein n=1 Tax=Nocardioides sp. ChNu-99 TaxID=2839897 RepID=UPI002405731A|nr:hypothetical protein [Nocardioides sp. ChNu-99]MDF9717373.1 hypothetical protein [Nocardioides sp. ChNu-99]